MWLYRYENEGYTKDVEVFKTKSEAIDCLETQVVWDIQLTAGLTRSDVEYYSSGKIYGAVLSTMEYRIQPISARICRLVQRMRGTRVFADWISEHHVDEDGFVSILYDILIEMKEDK